MFGLKIATAVVVGVAVGFGVASAGGNLTATIAFSLAAFVFCCYLGLLTDDLKGS